MNPPPIEARKQRLELSVAQRHQAILDAGPNEALLFQPLVGQDDTRAIPVDQLQSVCLARPEHKDRSSERVNGPLYSSFFTSAANPSWPLRKSTGFVATMIRTRFDGKIMS
jgi:hypothetical protein